MKNVQSLASSVTGEVLLVVCRSLSVQDSLGVAAGFVRCLQPVLVLRKDPDSRKNTIQEIDHRAKSGGRWPQVCRAEQRHKIFHPLGGLTAVCSPAGSDLS